MVISTVNDYINLEVQKIARKVCHLTARVKSTALSCQKLNLKTLLTILMSLKNRKIPSKIKIPQPILTKLLR